MPQWRNSIIYLYHLVTLSLALSDPTPWQNFNGVTIKITFKYKVLWITRVHVYSLHKRKYSLNSMKPSVPISSVVTVTKILPPLAITLTASV